MFFNKHILTKSGAIRTEQEIFGMHKPGETRPTAHTTLHHMYSSDYYSFGMKVSAHGDPQPVTHRGMLDQTVCQNFSAFTVPISEHHRFDFTFCTFSLLVLTVLSRSAIAV